MGLPGMIKSRNLYPPSVTQEPRVQVTSNSLTYKHHCASHPSVGWRGQEPDPVPEQELLSGHQRTSNVEITYLRDREITFIMKKVSWPRFT